MKGKGRRQMRNRTNMAEEKEGRNWNSGGGNKTYFLSSESFSLGRSNLQLIGSA